MNKDVVGQVFGRWTVLRQWTKDSKYTMLDVKCQCGLVASRRKSAITSGASKGCQACRPKETRYLPPRDMTLNGAITNVWSSYRGKAKKKGIEFSLDKKVFMELIQKPCYYCLEPWSNMQRGYHNNSLTLKYNGIDRFDSTKGYVSNNVLPCCKYCNRMKSDLTHQEFIARVARINRNWPEGSRLVMADVAKAYASAPDATVLTNA